LVRYAFRIVPELKSLTSFAAQRFELWCGQIQRPLTEGQKEIVRQIVANGAYSNKELREENISLFVQMARNYGSAEVDDEVRESLSGFMLRAG
jgi:type I restriction enzyme R subunit